MDNPLNGSPPFEQPAQPQQYPPQQQYEQPLQPLPPQQQYEQPQQPLPPQHPLPPQQQPVPPQQQPQPVHALVVPQPVTEAVPAFIGEGTEGLEKISQFIRPPRLKIVQGNSAQELKQNYGEGSLILQPGNVPICASNSWFHFVPVYFYAEYCTWNPYALKTQLPAIRARSLDPRSDIARKAMDPDKRNEVCPEDPKLIIKHSTHLCYVVCILGDSQAANIPVAMTFYRGDFAAGSNFASLLRMRGKNIYACQFEGRMGFRRNAAGEWWGIDVTNPSPESGVAAWVQDGESYKFYEDLYGKFKATDVQVDYEGEAEPDPSGGTF